MSLMALTVHGQKDKQVTHLVGSKKIGKTTVSVKLKGMGGEMTDYCKETTPYFIGHDLNGGTGSGTGSYIFEFEPAISKVRLNFSGISHTASDNEVVRIFINGKHHKIREEGKQNGCDAMALVTKDGDIGVADGVSVGGWIGTIIKGNIKTLEIQNKVLKGTPAGSLFSIFITAGKPLTVEEEQNLQRMREAGYVR